MGTGGAGRVGPVEVLIAEVDGGDKVVGDVAITVVLSGEELEP